MIVERDFTLAKFYVPQHAGRVAYKNGEKISLVSYKNSSEGGYFDKWGESEDDKKREDEIQRRKIRENINE